MIGIGNRMLRRRGMGAAGGGSRRGASGPGCVAGRAAGCHPRAHAYQPGTDAHPATPAQVMP